MRSGVLVVVSLLSAVLGGVAGFQFGRQAEASRTAFLQVQADKQFMQSQSVALASSDDAAVESALWRQIVALEIDERQSNPRYTEAIRAKDTALAYARLSDLALKQGSSSRAAALLAQAAALCPKTGWPECSPSSIVAMSRRISKAGVQ
jgi:hypothetical protein